jgi:flagellar basal-body rod protein FlgF
MDKGIYTALSGGIAKAHELELVANNLANANTPGFKSDQGTFNEYLMELRHPDSVEGVKRQITAETMQDGRPPGDKSFVEMDGIYTNYRQGDIHRTGRNLDVGLEGGGFFEILTPAGVRYTRQGNFSVAPDGKLVTVNGYAVLASPGPAPKEQTLIDLSTQGRLLGRNVAALNPPPPEVPPETRIIRLTGENVSVTPDGQLYQNGNRIGALSVQEFQEPQWLEKTGNGYFRNVRPENLKVGSVTTKTHQGFLESSNVNPVKEMTKLIEVTRAYESHMQAIKTYQEIDARTVNEIARER